MKLEFINAIRQVIKFSSQHSERIVSEKSEIMTKEVFEEFKQSDPNYSAEPLENQIKLWALWGIFEKMPYFLGNSFSWSPQEQSFLRRLSDLQSGFIVLTGPQGVGKTAFLVEAYAKLEDNYARCWFVSTTDLFGYSDSIAAELKILAHNLNRGFQTNERNLIFVDTPYHDKPSKTTLRNDLQGINKLWLQIRNYKVTLVFSISENWLMDKSVLNKTEEFKLYPFQPQEFLSAYRNIWKNPEPFTDDALLRLAEYSDGIFRKFMTLISICLQAKQTRGIKAPITKEIVKNLVLRDSLLKVLEHEFSLLFKGKKKNQALKIMEIVIESQIKLNQRQIAEKTGYSEATLSRIINKLNDKKYIEKTIGPHGQLFISLKFNEKY